MCATWPFVRIDDDLGPGKRGVVHDPFHGALEGQVVGIHIVEDLLELLKSASIQPIDNTEPSIKLCRRVEEEDLKKLMGLVCDWQKAPDAMMDLTANLSKKIMFHEEIRECEEAPNDCKKIACPVYNFLT